MKAIREGPAFTLYDGDNGLGQITVTKAMRACMEKATGSGVALALVKNTNHIGKCGYYSMLALERDMIGISMTNAAPLIAPTFGIDPMIGTNPIAIAAPAGKEPPFCLDMATSVRAYGRFDIRAREGRQIPLGWGIDHQGKFTVDPGDILGTAGYAKSGGKRGSVLPLGGFGDDTAGYKGYGLAVAVDILTGLLTGSPYGPQLALGFDPKLAGLTPLVAAIDIDSFRPLNEFKKDMDAMLRGLKNSRKGTAYSEEYKVLEDGIQVVLRNTGKEFERIYVAGEKGLELEREQMKNGVRLGNYAIKELEEINKQYNIGYRF
jgi:LDH2 family malate/lactate/ureidoglycolate dehydrogenase